MTETTEILGAPEPADKLDHARKPSPVATLRQLFATVISAAWPGAGHLMLGQLPKGMLLSGLFVGILCCYWPLRLPRFYAALATLVLSWLTLGLYSACSTQLVRNSKSGDRCSPWWLALTLPVALVILSLANTGVARASGFRPFTVPSVSMEPTIQQGDNVIVDTRAYGSSSPQYRDVIVFHHDGSFTTKRIIAIGGDTIEARADRVAVNGTLINESYIQRQPEANEVPGYDWMHSFGPITVPANQYFVMGDNRDISLDSRSPDYGFASRSQVVGKVLYVYRSARQGFRIR